MLVINQDVPVGLFSEIVEAVQVYGSIRASADVHKAIQQKAISG